MTTLLKFYADTPRGDRNRLFKRRCFGQQGVRNCIINHTKVHKFYIRAAWASDINRGIQSNHRRIDLSGYSENDINRTIFETINK